MKYMILILIALFGVVSVAVVRTYQLNANSSSPAATPNSATLSSTPVPTANSPIFQFAPQQNSQTPFEIRGKISSMRGDVIVVNGRSITVPSNADVKIKPKEKGNVVVTGYIRADGVYIAQQITPLGGNAGDESGD